MAIFYHVVFNGAIDIYDAIGQDVQQKMLPQNWVVKYSIGEKLTFMLEDLPTSQPVDAGIVWRDGNTLKIS